MWTHAPASSKGYFDNPKINSAVLFFSDTLRYKTFSRTSQLNLGTFSSIGGNFPCYSQYTNNLKQAVNTRGEWVSFKEHVIEVRK